MIFPFCYLIVRYSVQMTHGCRLWPSSLLTKNSLLPRLWHEYHVNKLYAFRELRGVTRGYFLTWVQVKLWTREGKGSYGRYRSSQDSFLFLVSRPAQFGRWSELWIEWTCWPFKFSVHPLLCAGFLVQQIVRFDLLTVLLPGCSTEWAWDSLRCFYWCRYYFWTNNSRRVQLIPFLVSRPAPDWMDLGSVGPSGFLFIFTATNFVMVL